MEFKWKYCPHCDAMYIECPKCGNNSCNAGRGEVDGEPCDVCPEVYEKLDKAYDSGENPPRPDDWKERVKKSHVEMAKVFQGEVTEKTHEEAEELIKKLERNHQRT